jgi:hypothetical protein
MQSEQPNIEDAVRGLQDSYMEYMKALKSVLDFGDANVRPLVEALNHKHANPVAKALGLMMYSDTACELAIPRLLDWLIVQSPLYPDVLEALVRAGRKAVPLLRQRLSDAASRGDDEAVRSLLDLSTRLRDRESLDWVVEEAIALLANYNSHIRESAADALWRIALPSGRVAVKVLTRIASEDPVEPVRRAAAEALDRLS